MKLPSSILSKVLSHKRDMAIAGISVALILGGIFFYLTCCYKKTYYLAYIGRFQREGFDPLHVLALNQYIEELNAELKGIRLELRIFDIKGSSEEARKIYEQISKDTRIVSVIDNTWGSEFQASAYSIRDSQIPVININSDYLGTDYGRNVVFLGNDDKVPEKVITFSKKILEDLEVIFITEESYALKSSFMKEFDRLGVKRTTLYVKSDKTDNDDRTILFDNLRQELSRLRNQYQKKATVIINTHSAWGNEIINYIDKEEKDVYILGGTYIINGTVYRNTFGEFGRNQKGNTLIILSNPIDAVTNKVYKDLNEIRRRLDVQIKNDQFFVKRCMDAVSIIRGVFFDGSDQIRSSVSRSDFIDFFHNRLASNDYVSSHNELFSFDKELLWKDERTFEAHSQGTAFSYQKQLNSQMVDIPNVYFGLDIINISNIDIENRSFHATFFYWIKYDRKYPNAREYFHFRNEKDPKPDEEKIDTETVDSKVYELYKKSGVFSIDVDFAKYPFDTQELKIEVEIINPIDDVYISFDHSDFENSKKRAEAFNLDEWNLEDFYVTVDNFITASFRGDLNSREKKLQKYKTLNVRMPISRRLTGPFVTIILPLLMIGLAAIAITYVKDNSFAHMGEVCIAIFLSIVTYSISFAEVTPRSNVLTIADILFYGTFFTVILIFLRVVFFNSILISDPVKKWTTGKATLNGSIALIGYSVMVIATLIYGLT